MKKNSTKAKTLYFDIKGAEAYIYVPDEMDKIGALYKNNYAQNARSVNMEDINQALGIKTEEQKKEKNVLPMLADAIQYGEKYGPLANQYTPEDWLKEGKLQSTVEGTVNGYAFAIGSEGLPPEASNIAVNIENARLKSMLFDNVEMRTGNAYWLASRGVFARSGSVYAYFGPGIVYFLDGVTMASIGNGTFISYGDEDDCSGIAAVRPVVSLKSEITKNEVPKIADRTEPEGGWNAEQ